VPRAKQRTPELRARLVDVAVATLATHGVAGFTTRRIAEGAATSVPAVYELFGDKAGLVREVFFEGFRRLDRSFEAFVDGADPRADLERVAAVFRAFVRDNALLFEVMFSRPFADFDPGPDELRAGTRVREFVVRQVQRGIDAGDLAGDATDIAHVLVALAQGLAAQEAAGWLGRSRASVDRRWAVAFTALLDGLRPQPPVPG
jgi:AcrR family transcriptional regulator